VLSHCKGLQTVRRRGLDHLARLKVRHKAHYSVTRCHALRLFTLPCGAPLRFVSS